MTKPIFTTSSVIQTYQKRPLTADTYIGRYTEEPEGFAGQYYTNYSEDDRGIYQHNGFEWAKVPDPPSTEVISMAAYDIMVSVKEGSGSVADYIGTGNDFQTAIIENVFAQNIEVLQDGSIRSGNRYKADGSDNEINGVGIWIGANGKIKGCGGMFDRLDVDKGVFKGTLDTPLITTGKAISTALTIVAPTATHWKGSDLRVEFPVGTWDSRGYFDGHDIYSATIGSSSMSLFKPYFGTTYITDEQYRNEVFNLTIPHGEPYVYSSTLTNYWQGSALIYELNNANIPMGSDITVSSSSFAGTTVTSLNYNASQVALTTSSASVITLLGTGFYDYSDSLSIPSQGADTLVVKGTISASMGTVYSEGTTSSGSYIRFAGGTQICWNTFVSPTTGQITWTFPVEFGDTNYAVAGSPKRDSVGNEVVAAIVRTNTTSQVVCRIVWGDGYASEPVSLMAIGRW